MKITATLTLPAALVFAIAGCDQASLEEPEGKSLAGTGFIADQKVYEHFLGHDVHLVQLKVFSVP